MRAVSGLGYRVGAGVVALPAFDGAARRGRDDDVPTRGPRR